MPKNDIWVSSRYDTKKSYLRQNDAIIDAFTEIYNGSRQYGRSVVAKENSVCIRTGAKQVNFFEDLVFGDIAAQKSHVSIDLPLNGKLGDFEIVPQRKMLVFLGSKGLLMTYDYQGTALFSYQIEFIPHQTITDLTPQQRKEITQNTISRTISMTIEPSKNSLVAVSLRTKKAKNRFKILSISEFNRIEELSHYVEPDVKLVGKGTCPHTPYYSLKSLKVVRGIWVFAGVKEDKPFTLNLFGFDGRVVENLRSLVGHSPFVYHMDVFDFGKNGGKDGSLNFALMTGTKKDLSLVRVRLMGKEEAQHEGMVMRN